MNYYVYILTDCNRKSLHVGSTNNLQNAINTYKEMYGLFFDVGSRISRLVYQESFASEEEALVRYNVISQYTRMQKERLIRRVNPNWIDISLARPHVHQILHSDKILFTNTETQKQIA